MKKITVLAAIVFCFVIHSKTVLCKEISISEALKKKMIAIKVKSTSGHTGECLSLRLVNLKNSKLNIIVEAGRMFIPADSNVQNLIVVKRENIELAPNQIKTNKITAVCAQKNDAGPRQDLIFTTGNFGNTEAKKFAEWLDTKAYYNNTNTQNAMWMFTDNMAPEFTINSERDKEMLAFVAQAKNLNYEKLLDKFTSKSTPDSRFRFSSTLNFTLSTPQVLKVVLCDKNNAIVKKCILGDTLAIGPNNKHIEFNNDDLENGKYYLKIYIDGKMIKRREIEIK
ncbi:MAG: hypothetical protein ACEQSR_00365 [Candidatus Methylacidiphilales bacterium]